MLLEVMDALNVMAICGYLAGAMLTSGERFTRVLLGWAVASVVLLAADELTGNHWWANFNIGAGASAILLWLYRRWRWRERAPKAMGAKSRALIAAMVRTVRERSRPRPVLRPAPGGAR